MIGKNEARTVIALTGQTGASRGFPAIKGHGDRDLIRRGPVSHRSSRQEISQSAVERHCGNHRNARVACRTCVAIEEGEHARLFRGYIQIWNAGAERSLNQGRRCVDKWSRAIDDRGSTGQSAVQRYRVVYQSHPRFHTWLRLAGCAQLCRIPTGKDGYQTTSPQFGNDKASGMTVSAEDRNRSMERHGTCVLLFRPRVDRRSRSQCLTRKYRHKSAAVARTFRLYGAHSASKAICAAALDVNA
jgi:hypothetical protein